MVLGQVGISAQPASSIMVQGEVNQQGYCSKESGAKMDNVGGGFDEQFTIQIDNTTALTRKTADNERRKRDRQRNEPLTNLPEVEIESLSIYINDEETERISAVEVTSSDWYGEDTVNDPRMGPVDAKTSCSSCTGTLTGYCIGHYGHIRLKSPYADEIGQRLAVQVLNSICICCGNMVLTDTQLQIEKIMIPSGTGHTFRHQNQERLVTIEEKSKGKPCQAMDKNGKPCNCPRLLFKFGDGKAKRIFYTTNLRGKHKNWFAINLLQVKKIFTRISDETAVKLGFNLPSHPRHLIRQNISVMPRCTRAPMMTTNGRDGHADLTKLYRSIVVANNEIDGEDQLGEVNSYGFLKLIDFNQSNRENKINKLMNAINKMVMGETGSTEKNGSIKDQVQGKEGYIRKYMTGKRGNMTARSVIIPGPEMEFGEVGVPEVFSTILTYPVTITPNNKQAAEAMIRSGKVSKIRYGGRQGFTVRVDPGTMPKRAVEVGDVIERHMQDGDYVALSRNPVLHKFGVMGYRVRLVPGLAIRLPIGTTPHHNADFDGDEMNLFVPRSNEAIAELSTIAAARNCLINGQDNRPLANLVFNDLTAAYKLTLPETTVSETTWNDCLRIIVKNRRPDEPPTQLATLTQRLKDFGVRERSGWALFSAILPETFDYQRKGLIIKRGILIGGSITKAQGGSGHRTIIQDIVAQYGRKRGAQYMSDAQFILKRYNQDNPVTVSLGDCFPTPDPDKEAIPIYDIIIAQDELDLLDYDFCMETLISNSSYLTKESFEQLPIRVEPYSLTPDMGAYWISSLLPTSFNLDYNDQPYIRDGVLIGNVPTSSVGRNIGRDLHKDILRTLHQTPYSTSRALGFSSDLTTLLVRCLGLPEKKGDFYERRRQAIEQGYSLMQQIGPDFNDPLKRAQAEQTVSARLNQIGTWGDQIIKQNLDTDNNFLTIMSAGTKGSPINVAQIMFGLGMQFNGNQMIGQGGRSTPFQAMGDYDPEGFGMIYSNFLGGLSPLEFFYHAAAGRVGLVDTSIKTADPGRLTRILIKNLEDLKVLNDRSIRLLSGHLVQSYYGESALNPEELLNVQFPGGDLPFFIDIETEARHLNEVYGYL